MKMLLEFSREDMQEEIPYQIVAETVSCSIWNTGRRKRLMDQYFDESEQKRIYDLARQACSWYLASGAPMNGVRMTYQTYQLWHRLAEFCSSL